jgi:hypothetical protein
VGLGSKPRCRKIAREESARRRGRIARGALPARPSKQKRRDPQAAHRSRVHPVPASTHRGPRGLPGPSDPPAFLVRCASRVLRAPRCRRSRFLLTSESHAKLFGERETLPNVPPPEKPPVPNEEPPKTTPPVMDPPPDPKTDPTAIDPDDAQIEPPKDDAFKKK